VQPLQTTDVQNIVKVAVNSVNVDMAGAVVDRADSCWACFERRNAPVTTIGILGSAGRKRCAVALARTGAFFSNDQAPLSSRTVRSSVESISAGGNEPAACGLVWIEKRIVAAL